MASREINREEYKYGYQGGFSEEDEETGWNSFELRMYDPVVARWISPDPYGQYWSPYLAMGNNPVNNVDPDGGFSGGGDPPSVSRIEHQSLTSEIEMGQLMVNSGMLGESIIGSGLASIFVTGDLWTKADERAYRQAYRASQNNLSGAAGRHKFLEQSFVHNVNEGVPKAIDLFGQLNGLSSVNTSDDPNQIAMAPALPFLRFGKGANQVSHAFRHTDALGLARETVVTAIRTHFKGVSSQIVKGQPFNQTIVVAGQRIQYTAFKLENGTVNIGRIHGVK